MIEFIKHSLGLCGEAHPNVFTLLLGTPAISYIIYKFKKNNGKFTKITRRNQRTNSVN